MKRLIIDALIFENTKAFGYQEYLFNLIDYIYLQRNMLYFENITILCDSRQKKYFDKYSDKITIVGYPIRNKFEHLFIQNIFEFDLRLKASDVILFTYNYSSLFKRCKHVLVVHDLLYLRKMYLPNTLMRLQRRIYLPISLKKAEVVITISEFTKEDIIKKYKINSDKIFSVYNYLNFLKYSNPMLPTDFELKDKSFYLSICSAAKHKNTITVLKAFNKYVNSGGQKLIVFVGALADNNSEAFKYYIKMPSNIKNRIVFLNKITNSELAMLYLKAFAFITATLFEGFGMPVIEAMYFNLPEIVSDISVLRELCQDKVFYFNPLDYETLSTKMFDIENNKVIVENKKYVVDKFNELNTSGKYIDILNKLY